MTLVISDKHSNNLSIFLKMKGLDWIIFFVGPMKIVIIVTDTTALTNEFTYMQELECSTEASNKKASCLEDASLTII